MSTANGAPPASFSERVVSRLSTGVFGRRSTRRGFLATTALVGSAIATEPWKYLAQPVSAYDAVCGDGNECANGWTAFCCSVSGANQCPGGSFVGGWWKADNSSFCCGGARYYIDCNALCGSSWNGACHCNANGTCDRRRVACNQFRYGQCNQQISCYGPVVCRVITCTPPWQYDGSCTAASATDNRTASHSAPCLSEHCDSAIMQHWYDYGGPSGILGNIVQSERPDPTGRGHYAIFQHGAIYSALYVGTHAVRGGIWDEYNRLGGSLSPDGFPTTEELGTPDGIGRYSHFEQGSIYYTRSTGPHEVRGAIRDTWASLGWEQSVIGYPVTNELGTPDGIGRFNHFQRGSIYFTADTGAHEVRGGIRDKWAQLGWEQSVIGYPVTNELGTPDGIGRFNHFQRGSIYYTRALGPHEVRGGIRDKWAQLGWEQSVIGYPTSDELGCPDGVGRCSHFERGSIYYTKATGPHEVRGAIYDKWGLLGWQSSLLKYPITDELAASDGAGRYNDFQGGSIYYSRASGPHEIHGPLRDRWRSMGDVRSSLGYPVSDVYTEAGRQRIDFEHGSLVYDPATGQVTQV